MVVIAEQVLLTVSVTGCDKFLQAEKLKVTGEAVIEVADFRVITVAVDHLALKMRFVVYELIFNVRQLRIEIVILLSPSLVKILN